MSNIHLRSISSTNDYLKEMSERLPLPDWSCVRADYQSKGRGQRGNEWISEKGKNLLVSYWLKPTAIGPHASFDLNRMVCLALLRVLKNYGLSKLSIKWPNDILVGNNKIAGVLIENSLSMRSVETSIIGIGLNVHQVEFMNVQATSIALCKTGKWQIELINEDVMCELKKAYTELITDAHEFRKSYLEHLFGRNNFIRYLFKGLECQGRVVTVNLEGKIGIENTKGDVTHFGFKEIEFLLSD